MTLAGLSVNPLSFGGRQGLKDKAEGISTPKGVAPDWTRYITVSVDVQGTYFSVGVTAWGEGGKHQPIDRFDLVNPPATAPGAEGRALKPFEIAEDWAVLEDLPHRAWPVDGGEWLLKPAAIAIDVHGGGASTDHAYKFYRGRKKAGEARRWYLTRGHGGLNHPDRVWLRAPERTSNKNRKAAVDIKILNMATDRLKDATAASLRLSDDGHNITVIPEWMSVAELTEFTAERRTEKGWEKRQGMVRNESFDHAVQARALHIILGGERIDWSDPLPWVTLAEGNDFAVSAGTAPKPDDPVAPKPNRLAERDAPRNPGRGGWIQRRDTWI